MNRIDSFAAHEGDRAGNPRSACGRPPKIFGPNPEAALASFCGRARSKTEVQAETGPHRSRQCR